MNFKQVFSKEKVTTVIRYDLPSGLLVFFVALPLCVGIPFFSGAPVVSGVIAGIVGGVVVSLISNSKLSVSGPAAGLIIIVSSAVNELGSYEAFLTALVIAGVMQIVMGVLKFGFVGSFFPGSVIKGMLAAIGIILFLKQIPHLLGYDIDHEGDFNFFQWDNQNTFSEIVEALRHTTPGAIMISLFSLSILYIWEKKKLSSKLYIHGAIIVVALAVMLNNLFNYFFPVLYINEEHLVSVLPAQGINSILNEMPLPDYAYLYNSKTYLIAFEIAVIASLESMLSLDAIEKIDPLRRHASKNRELIAQGVGNMICGAIGGMPITSVIVRSSANLNAGAKTQMSSFFHGIFLIIALLFIPDIINDIPMAALASILTLTGYKLARMDIFIGMYKKGWEHFLPFAITILAIVFSNLLIGVSIGMVAGMFFIIRRNILNPFKYEKKPSEFGTTVKIELAEEVSFLNKASIQYNLNKIPEHTHVIIDGSRSRYIDPDVMECIEDFKINAPFKNIKVEILNTEGKSKSFKNTEQYSEEKVHHTEHEHW
ncbi:MAG: SulP family inorganic anion transporter [Cytophagaceae bacterium]|nr:SulP family inorganic anion transporter [Cytophagaceae bacterium]MDW8455704.1 SulP family inorganic anion transporter [Cytophagaceae bacterium]